MEWTRRCCGLLWPVSDSNTIQTSPGDSDWLVAFFGKGPNELKTQSSSALAPTWGSQCQGEAVARGDNKGKELSSSRQKAARQPNTRSTLNFTAAESKGLLLYPLTNHNSLQACWNQQGSGLCGAVTAQIFPKVDISFSFFLLPVCSCFYDCEHCFHFLLFVLLLFLPPFFPP